MSYHQCYACSVCWNDILGFSVALFKPNVAVDAMGRVFVLTEEDFSALSALAAETAGLPTTGSFRNQWRQVNPTSILALHLILIIY